MTRTDGSFTVVDLNAVLSPEEILPIAQEKKRDILGNFSYFITRLYVVCTHQNRFIDETPNLSLYASWPGASGSNYPCL